MGPLMRPHLEHEGQVTGLDLHRGPDGQPAQRHDQRRDVQLVVDAILDPLHLIDGQPVL